MVSGFAVSAREPPLQHLRPRAQSQGGVRQPLLQSAVVAKKELATGGLRARAVVAKVLVVVGKKKAVVGRALTAAEKRKTVVVVVVVAAARVGG